jgi:hypothetical protein
MAGKLTHGGPLPDGHPFKGGLILFGSNIPEAWKEKLRKKTQAPPPEQPSPLEEEQPPTRRELDDLEAQAFNDHEEELSRSIEEKVRDKK